MDTQQHEKVTEVIGFDLGHGETALTIAAVTANTEPQVLDVQDRRSFITAVAVHPKRGVIIGEEAYTARNLDSLTVRFKSPHLDRAEVREPIKLFARKILDTLKANKLIRGNGESRFIIGCPSGWPPETREQYADLMREAGFDPVSIVAESRAAFIHAKESEELHLSGDTLLSRAVLIVDVGSSTTDFTAVQNLKERYIDFGDIQLGAGLLDQAILERITSTHERRPELQEIFESYPQYQAMCELKCRSVKETYFSNEKRWVEESVQETLKIPTRPPIFFDIELNKADMEHILGLPLLKEKNRAKTWPKALHEELEAAKRQMSDSPPEIVFLTGGASRMNFIVDMCHEIFPDATVLRGKEPELSIAKGLAWVGRIDLKTRAFRGEIRYLLESGQIQRIIDERLPQLLSMVANRLAQALPEQIVLPAFHDWRSGKIKTLDELEKSIEYGTQSWLISSEGKQTLAPAAEEWFAQIISPQVEQAVNPVCDRYGIPRAAFNLNSGNAWEGRLPNGLVSGAWGFDGLDTLTGVVVAIVLANLAGGSGTALIMSGGVGFVIGLIAGLITFVVGRNAAKKWSKTADLPLWARWLAREERLRDKLQDNQGTLQHKLSHSLSSDHAAIERISEEIHESVQIQLNKSVEEVVLLIK